VATIANGNGTRDRPMIRVPRGPLKSGTPGRGFVLLASFATLTMVVAAALAAGLPSLTQQALRGTEVVETSQMEAGPPPRVEASGNLSVSVPIATPSVLDAGEQLRLNVSVTGGEPPYNLSWESLPSGCNSQNSSQISCRPGAPTGEPTTSRIYVEVADSNGSTATSSETPVTVNPIPTVAISSSSNVGTAPLSVNFTATTFYGTAPFTFQWQFGDGSTGTGQYVNHVYTTVGQFHVNVTAFDSVGKNSTSHYPIQVVAVLNGVVSVSPSTGVVAGSSFTLRVAASGGLAAYSYVWTGLPASCSSVDAASLSCTTSTVGSYRVTVQITDRLDHTANATIVVTVSPPTPIARWVGLGIMVTIVFAGVVLVLRRRSRRRREGSNAPPAASLPPQANGQSGTARQ